MKTYLICLSDCTYKNKSYKKNDIVFFNDIKQELKTYESIQFYQNNFTFIYK